jgi:hypothetical protein
VKDANNPWMKFYPSDWRSDPMLRLCSLAARGLWIELMCLMHEAEPYGSMLVNGKRINKTQMAALVGIPEKECSALMLELEGAGVFSRDEDGTIFSRRMRRDHKKAEDGRVSIAKRWGEKDGNSKTADEPNRSPNRSDNVSSADAPNTQKPEARSQIPEKEGTREVALVPSGWPTDFFDQFWKKYPNKVDRAGSMKSLARVAKKGGIEFSTIMDGLDAYVAKTDDRPWCNPTTWINQARWEHRPAEVPPHGKAQKPGGSLMASIDAELARSIEEDRRLAMHESPVLRLSH